MERERVAKTWIYRGLCDLFFAFHNDYPGFADQARFCEIMALEKFLKALLLYKNSDAYEAQNDHNARQTLNKLAKDLGHNFSDMLEELAQKGHLWVEQANSTEFGPFKGEKLARALEKGYMECRYPVPKPASDDFPSGFKGIKWDPLSSSGTTEFIYMVCNSCFDDLATTIDLTDMLSQFDQVFAGKSLQLQQFKNTFRPQWFRSINAVVEKEVREPPSLTSMEQILAEGSAET